MNPDQNPLDYLNQIAPVKQRKDFLRTLRPVHYIIGIVLVLILLIVVVSLLANAANAPKVQLQRLAARLQATTTIAQNANANIRDGNLEVINSNLQIYLTNMNQAIIKPMAAVGVNAKSLPSNIVASEKDPGQITEELTNAHLSGTFDSTYARDMAYQLATTMTLMKEIYQSTPSSSLKSFLETSYNNLQPTQQSFASFTTTTE